MRSLRSAITYIRSLQDLLQDCEDGKINEEDYKTSAMLDLKEKQMSKPVMTKKRRRKSDTKRKNPERNKLNKIQPIKWNDCSTKFSSTTTNLNQVTLKESDKKFVHYDLLHNTPVALPLELQKEENDISLNLTLVDKLTDSFNTSDKLIYVYQIV